MWDIKELRNTICEDRQDSQAVLGIIYSIERYIDIFHFHLYGARDALDEVIDPKAADQIEALAIIFGASEGQADYNSAKVASDAHILGVAHSARAMFDVFAFLVNYLVLEGKVPESRCNIQLVVKKLSSSPFKQELEGLVESYWFTYVSAFVNVAKHRMLASHSFHVGFDDPYTGIRVGAFDYNGTKYPRYKVQEFLEGMVEIKNKIVSCGSLLNNHMLQGWV